VLFQASSFGHSAVISLPQLLDSVTNQQDQGHRRCGYYVCLQTPVLYYYRNWKS